MARQMVRLNVAKIKSLAPGMHGDGGNLWLQVSASGAASWVFRFTKDGRSREMGLGSLRSVSLAEARKEAAECRLLLSGGLDPIRHREAKAAADRLKEARTITFQDCAEAYIEAHKAGWKNAKHIEQWQSTLVDYAYRSLGNLAVGDIDTALVMRVVQSIWYTKPETASRLLGRIKSILDWATVRQYRAGTNPAMWKGHLDHMLPSRRKIAPIVHHPALPYPEVGAFMANLRLQDGIAARALELTILTATRTSETLLAEWREFDLEQKHWIIPASRMKARKEHKVPLSPSALKVLLAMREQREGDFVFPGSKPKRPLSNMAMLAVLRRMNRQDITVHGFRSSFRDWASEVTTHNHEVAEMALAHTIGNQVEAAYRRGSLYLKRVRLMDDWAAYCESAEPPTAEVHILRSATAT